MEPVPLCKGEIILTETDDDRLYQSAESAGVSAVIAQSPSDIARVRLLCETLPVGVLICADSIEDPEIIWDTEKVIDGFKEQTKAAEKNEADFVYLRMTSSFRALRCAVLAVTDVSGQGIMAELPITSEGLLSDGTNPIAAMGILQRIGVSSLVLTGDSVEDISAALEEIAPYARISLGVKAEPDWLRADIKLVNAEFFLAKDASETEKLCNAACGFKGVYYEKREHDFLLAPDGKNPHFISPTVDISDPISVSDHLAEDLIALEDSLIGAIKLEVNSEEDILCLSEHQYMVSRPVCITSENPELFETALRVYEGLAIYDGTWELETSILRYLTDKYGLIVL